MRLNLVDGKTDSQNLNETYYEFRYAEKSA